MKNRGFPPEEQQVAAVQRRKSSIFLQNMAEANEPRPTLKDAAQTVILISNVARRLSQKDDTTASFSEPSPDPDPVSSVFLSAKVARSKEKFKKQRKNMTPVMETEETVLETVIDFEPQSQNGLLVGFETAERPDTQNDVTAVTYAVADSESITTAL